MDIFAYNFVLDGLRKYNAEAANNYGNVVVPFPTTDTTYPNTVFSEIRNTANPLYNAPHERVASVGYRADIFAKNKGNKVDKQTVARAILQIVDDYLTNIGLTRISFNIDNLVDDASIFHIIVTYAGNLHETRRRFI